MSWALQSCSCCLSLGTSLNVLEWAAAFSTTSLTTWTCQKFRTFARCLSVSTATLWSSFCTDRVSSSSKPVIQQLSYSTCNLEDLLRRPL